MRSFAISVSIALGLSVTLPVSAQDSPPDPATDPAVGTIATASSALSTELFNAARELMSRGHYAEACPKLVESAKLEQRVGTLGKLAECEEQLGLLVNSRARWQQTVNLARAQRDERLAAAEQELARVDARVPKLRFVTSESPLLGLSIKLDGLELGASVVGIDIPIDPGHHTITVVAPGKKQWSTTVDPMANGAVTSVPLPALEDQESKAGREVATPPPKESSMSSTRMLALIAGGASAVSLGLGTYFGAMAISKLEESNDAGCKDNICPSNAADLRREARAAGDGSTALFITGGVLAAGAITLWFLPPPKKESGAPTVRGSVGAGPGGAHFIVQGRF